MITLNGNRTKTTINDVLTELDAFEAETMTTAKPFTAFILDIDREENDPLIVHFETTSGTMMAGDIETAYFYELDCGANVEGFDPEYVPSDSIGALWCQQGAAVIGVVAGHETLAWNPDGCGAAEYEQAFNGDAPTADPFHETYKSAWVSTGHLTAETLAYLNAIPSDLLPFWISPTLYGWIVRFDALDTIGLADAGEEESRDLAQCADLQAIKARLYTHGYQAAHLDADGPVIDGLQEYDHA